MEVDFNCQLKPIQAEILFFSDSENISLKYYSANVHINWEDDYNRKCSYHLRFRGSEDACKAIKDKKCFENFREVFGEDAINKGKEHLINSAKRLINCISSI